MLTNCLAECAHLTITVSQIERDIGRKSSFFHTPLHSTRTLGESRRNTATPFGAEKLEWCGYPTVKKFRRYLYSFWRNSRTWQTDGQTDGRTPRAGIYRAYAYASRGKHYGKMKKGDVFWTTYICLIVNITEMFYFSVQTVLFPAHGSGRSRNFST